MSSIIPVEQSIEQNYQILGKLGEGTFACVFMVRHKTTNQKYAIKQIQVRQIEMDDALRQIDFLRKAVNDHIILFNSFFYDSDQSCLNIVMNLQAESLRKQLQSKVYSPEEIIEFLVQMVSAFLQLSNKKLLHLDLKPQNILVSKYNPKYYKICDFGCTQMNLQSIVSKYKNQVFGTFNYLAPQNYYNITQKKPAFSADIWSLGITVYQMIYKSLPFHLTQQGIINRKDMQKYFNGDQSLIQYPKVNQSQQSFDGIIRILKKMLKPKPNDRISWTDLKKILIEEHSVNSYQFLDVRKTYFKHMDLLKLFANFILLIRKNIELSVHNFWVCNKKILESFGHCLVHLSYLYCELFNKFFSYKMTQKLKIEEIDEMNELSSCFKQQEQKITKLSQEKIVKINDLNRCQILVLQHAQKCKELLKNHSNNFWDSMYDLQCFCDQTITCGLKNKSFFASGDDQNFGEALIAMQINQSRRYQN